MEKSPKNNPRIPESEHEQRQLNGTIKQSSESGNFDGNYNSVKDVYKNEYETSQKVPVEEKKEEVMKIKTTTHERR